MFPGIRFLLLLALLSLLLYNFASLANDVSTSLHYFCESFLFLLNFYEFYLSRFLVCLHLTYPLVIHSFSPSFCMSISILVSPFFMHFVILIYKVKGIFTFGAFHPPPFFFEKWQCLEL